MSTFTLPDLGEGLREAEIVAWHVEAGARVVADQPLVSVETDKAVVEIPSPRSGVVARLHGEPGDLLPVGAPLVDFEDEAGAGAGDSGTVVGRLGAESTRVDEAAEGAEAAPARPAAARAKATPAVRALARRLGVDLAAVDPTGRDGLITADDVRRTATALEAAGPAEPLRGVRRAMAQKMARAHAEVVPASVYDEADVEVWGEGADVTVRLVRAVVAGCRAEPSLNAWYDSAAGARRLLARIDLGIAVDIEEGLFVPVLRDAGNRDAADLRRGLEAMKRDVRARAVPPEELRGATITLSNFGAFGAGRGAVLVVVPPQVAIVGAGRIRAEAVAREGKLAVRRMLPLSLTFDHRVVTGGEATRFLAALIADLARGE